MSNIVKFIITFFKNIYTLVILLIVFTIYNVLLYKEFLIKAQCTYINVYFIYAFLYFLILVTFYKYNVIKTNLLLFITILFFVENYCIYFNKGILTYEEKLGVKQYTSLYAKADRYGFDTFNNWITKPYTEYFQTNSDFSFFKKFNSIGLRDIELDSTELSTKNVIIIIGDSFTEGNGAPQDSTLPALLETKLNNENICNCKIINAGAAGSDPVYEYQLFSTKLIQYHPKVLILNINISDIIDLMTRKGFNRYQNNKINYYNPPKWEYLYATSRVFRLIAYNFFSIDPYLLINKTKKHFRYQKAYNDFLLSVAKFEMLTKQINCKLIIVYSPHLFEFSNMANTENINFVFENDLKVDNRKNKFGVNFIFLKDSLIKYNLIDTSSMYDFYWKHDYHFKPIGYDAWAKLMHLKIKEEGVCKSVK